MKARLTIEAGDARPESLELEPTQAASLGRSRDNTVVLRSEHASRLHAKVLFQDGRWQVEDFGLNGTFVNGERIQQRADLAHGQEIRIGEIRLRFTLDQPSPSTVGMKASSTERSSRLTLSGPASTSRLHSSDMSVLCAFMAAHVGDSDPLALLREALALLLNQSGAAVAGYLSPDPADPLPKAVQPENGGFDNAFTRHMTRKAQRDGKSIWLATEISDSRPSDTLGEITDAVCVPVKFGGAALGMLHAVRRENFFTERDVRFAEAMADFLAGCLTGLQDRHNLEMEVERLRAHPPVLDDLIGDSGAMVQLRQQIAQVAAQPVPVLLRGEPGVGLDVVAAALHRRGSRARGPLVAVSCSAIAPALLEGELFSQRPGPGGKGTQPGYAAQADGGTLYLDEVMDLPPDAQLRLLRLIDEKCFRPPGTNQEIRAEVRVIAATHADLDSAAARGRFRQPLLDRLGQAIVEVPPLRTHLEDVPYLVQYFLDRLAVECRREVTLTEAAMQKLQAYVWPGNERQLRAELEAASLRGGKDLIDEGDILLGCENLLLVRR